MTYKGYLIDLDGTIYLGNEPIEAGTRFVKSLQQSNIPYLFVTNNTTKSPIDVQKKLKKTCHLDVPIETIYTASLATVEYMKELNLGNTAYVIGESGLKESIFSAGFSEELETPDYVVVGLDTNVTYTELKIATLAIQKGAHFIGTNPDKNIPTDSGLLPGAGSLIACIEVATQQKATYIGKPNRIIMDKSLEHLGLSKKDVIMVGDNYETDIKSALDNEIDSLLVLTGFTHKDHIEGLPEKPTYIVDTLDDWNI